EHLAHEVAVAPGTRLRALVGVDRLPVNSMHHQGVHRLGAGLVASATADDGLVEALEGQGAPFLVGVQWHPEVFEMTDPRTRHLFGDFIAAARGWAAARAPGGAAEAA
ncbi:MAG: gamma-glutamyl-gamma-aminobutyrate hydrolase family protein, partial [Gemmatimonadetes bacterium]|nr:gamma-glutamyl-gamma-aminobutyrate hydrolase family protein [Gemmatimonadota bacterium]